MSAATSTMTPEEEATWAEQCAAGKLFENERTDFEAYPAVKAAREMYPGRDHLPRGAGRRIARELGMPHATTWWQLYRAGITGCLSNVCFCYGPRVHKERSRLR